MLVVVGIRQELQVLLIKLGLNRSRSRHDTIVAMRAGEESGVAGGEPRVVHGRAAHGPPHDVAGEAPLGRGIETREAVHQTGEKVDTRLHVIQHDG